LQAKLCGLVDEIDQTGRKDREEREQQHDDQHDVERNGFLFKNWEESISYKKNPTA